MKIVVDVMGGDYAPEEIIKGCIDALAARSDFKLVMVGKKAIIEECVLKYPVKMDRIEIVDASECITNDEVPTVAVKTKRNSSLVVACEYVKNDPEAVGMVSAGSSGAVLTAATLKLGRIKGVSRPALAPLLPSLSGVGTLLIDCGANIDCKPQMLLQFALMGSAYMQSMHGIDSPRVALLSNGTEDKKGNELVQQAFALIAAREDINFVGNMEARDMLSGEYDVIVADGFYGNIALKAAEGTAKTLLTMIKKELTSSFSGKLGALLLRKSFMRIKEFMDYNKRGGAPFVGVNKLVIKAHGSSKAVSICGAVLQVASMHEGRLIESIKMQLNNQNDEEKRE